MSPLFVTKIERELPISAVMFRVGEALPSNHALNLANISRRDVKGILRIDKNPQGRCSPTVLLSAMVTAF